MIETVKKAFEVLSWVLNNPDGVTASDVAKALNMSLPNAYKYLATLESLGVLVKQENKKYTGGFRLLEYGSAVLRNLDVRQIARPYLIDLLIKTDQTVHLVIKDGFEGVYVEKLESAKSLPLVSKVGMRTPFYCKAFGKAILAHLPEEEIEEYLKSVKLEKKTDHTITDPEVLKEELKRVRDKGYAVDNEESEIGVACAGAAILNHDGYPIAGISISGVASRILPRINEYGKLVKDCAKEISEILGYRESK